MEKITQENVLKSVSNSFCWSADEITLDTKFPDLDLEVDDIMDLMGGLENDLGIDIGAQEDLLGAMNEEEGWWEFNCKDVRDLSNRLINYSNGIQETEERQ